MKGDMYQDGGAGESLCALAVAVEEAASLVLLLALLLLVSVEASVLLRSPPDEQKSENHFCRVERSEALVQTSSQVPSAEVLSWVSRLDWQKQVT